MSGWAGIILRLNLTEGSVARQVTAELGKDWLGGRALGHAISYAENSPEVGAFDPESTMVMAPGLFAGTAVPCSGRTQVTFRSPYPSGWGDSNFGGQWGAELRFAGYDALVISGRAQSPIYIWIDDDKVEFRDAAGLWGLSTWETQSRIRQELGDDDIAVVCIGPAGENRVLFACLMTELTNAAGRTGAGAVFGSKNLKAIAVRGTKGVAIARPKEFVDAAAVVYEHLQKEEVVQELGEHGTHGGTDGIAMIGMLPIKNHQECGFWDKGPELSIETLERMADMRHSACFACSMHCHHHYEVKERRADGSRLSGAAPEYETVASLGHKCGCSDLVTVLECTNLCNQYGLDTNGTGSMIALLMDLTEKGIISREDTDGLELTWGNGAAMVATIRKIACREGFGDRLAQDALDFARALGPAAERRVVHNKGLSCDAVECRGAIGAALSYAVSPRGATHHSGIPTVEWVPDPAMAQYVCGHAEGSDSSSYHSEAKAKAVIYYERLFVIQDSLGICRFAYGHEPTWHSSPEDLDLMWQLLMRLVTAATGREYTMEDLLLIADRAWNLEKLFLVSMGMTRADDDHCERMYSETCPGSHPIGPQPLPPIDRKKFEEILSTYYHLKGWDEQGVPTAELLSKLGLESRLPKSPAGRATSRLRFAPVER